MVEVLYDFELINLLSFHYKRLNDLLFRLVNVSFITLF